METKQSVKLIYSSPVALISNAIRYSHSNHNLSDSKFFYIEGKAIDIIVGEKDFNLIKRVGFKMKHESVLEFGTLIFDVKMSTKALLEESRHRVGISKTVTSSRYALNKIDILFELTNDKEIDDDLEWWKHQIETRLKQNKPLDKVSKMLPQAFIYSMQWQFNLRSLLHFLRLRLTKEAHIDIRIIAKLLIDALPNDYRELVLLDNKIKENYDIINNLKKNKG